METTGSLPPLKTIHLADGATFNLLHDEDPPNPRDDDNLTIMVCFHRRYILGDKHEYDARDFTGWDELLAQLEHDHHPVVIKPLYLYDHSGITISTTPFNDPWDSGQIGFVMVPRDKALSCWQVKRISPRIRQRCEDALNVEVSIYDEYLRGETYGYEIIAQDEVIDSCWGFIGDLKDNGILDNVPCQYREQISNNV